MERSSRKTIPQGLKPHFFIALIGTTEQAAEKLIERCIFVIVDAAGAEARRHLASFIGTTEVVP
ncbi:MAG: hypothetical protein WAL75_11615 [Terracidiphilus sp.]